MTSGRRAVSSLPPDVADFTGRGEAISALDAALNEPDTDRQRAVMVEGMPGVGKTALTIHWAHLIGDRFPDGHLYLDLRGDADQAALTRDEVLWQILLALGVPGGQIPGPGAARTAAYHNRIAGRRILTVLDNVHDEDQVRDLIPRSPGPLMVLTCRSHLRELANHDQVLTLKLGVLAPDEAVALLTSVIGEQRISDEPGAAKELAEMCGYLPLALRIVAANVARTPDAALAEAVRDLEAEPLSALTLHDNRGVAVRTTLDLSYRSLGEDLRRTFRLLGLFGGRDITTEVAAALLDTFPEEAHPLIAKLRLANLIERTGPGRYRLHDLLRDYARERADADEDDAARQAAVHRLLTWYLATARDMGDFLGQRRRRMDWPRVTHIAADPQDWESRLAWFESERQNLVAVTGQAASAGQDRLTWELADAVYDFLKLRSYVHDNVEVHSLGLAAAQRAGRLSAQIYMWHHLSVIYQALGEYDAALREARQALDASIRLRDHYLEAAVRNNLAEIRYATGKYAESLRQAQAALAMRRQIADSLGQAQTLNSLSRIQRALGRYPEAFENARAALDLRQEIGDSLGAAEALDTLARLYRFSGSYDEALDHGYRALRIRQQHGDRIGEGESLQGLARVYRRLGVYTQAQEYAERALELTEDVGNARGVADAYATLGDIYLDSSRDPDALEPYGHAMEIRHRIGDSRGITDSYLSLARAHRKLGEHQRSSQDARKALDICTETGDRFSQARALDSLARTYQLTRHYDSALECAEQALQIQHDIGDRRGLGNTLDNIAGIYRRTGAYGRALEFALRARETLAADGDPRGQAKALDNIAHIQLELGRFRPAIEAARDAAAIWAELGDRASLTQTIDILVRIASGRIPAAGDTGAGTEQSGESGQEDDGRQAGRTPPPVPRASLWHALADGFGGVFDLFGAARRPMEELPSFESTLAAQVHELCRVHGLAAPDGGQRPAADGTDRPDHPHPNGSPAARRHGS